MVMTQDNFLSRWSRLKTEKPLPQVEPEKPLEDLQERIAALPSIESIVSGADISAFMQAWVPAPLRNAVLRKMWTIDASLTEHLCQPLDYAYDYNNPVGVMGFGAMPEGFNALEEAEKLFKTIIEPIKPVEIIEIEEEQVAKIEQEPIPQEQIFAEDQPRKHGGALPT
jgi:Protein of unknown function (DUF3306)